MLYSNKKPALRRVIFQKLYIALSSASISRDRFLSPSRYCGVNTSFLDSCSSFSTTDWRELFRRVSILWTLFRSRVKSSIATFRLYVGEFWSGLLSCENTIAARLRYSIKKAKAFKLGHYQKSDAHTHQAEVVTRWFKSRAPQLVSGDVSKIKEKNMSNRAPILTEPFTHEQVDEYYADMYKHVVSDPKPPLDFKTLMAVHNFFEFEANSGMMLDAWLHAELQKVTGKTYLKPEDEPKGEKYGW